MRVNTSKKAVGAPYKKTRELHLKRLVFWRITKDKYEEKRKEYREKQKEITKKISKLNYADEEYYLTSEYLLKLASNASKLFESSEVHEKRLLLKMTLRNLELEGKKVRFDWIKPFDKIANLASRQAWLLGEDSNLRPAA